jgi:hypothetical protein
MIIIKSNFTQNYAIGYFSAAITFIFVLCNIVAGASFSRTLLFVFSILAIFSITTFIKNLSYYSNLIQSGNVIISSHFVYHRQIIHFKDIRNINLSGCQMRGAMN